MNKNKPFIPTLLFTLTLVLGPNAFASEYKNTKLINILMPAPFADSTKKLVKDFNKSNKDNIKIKITRGPRETESVSDLAISSLILGKSPYDILLVDVTWLPKYASAGWLEPLDALVTKKQLSTLAKGALKGNTFRKKLYRWPLVADMGLLFWRTDLMKSPPNTPQELINISRKLQKEGRVKYGYVWQGKQYEGLSCVFLEVLNGFGGEWISNDNKVLLNSDESKKAIGWLKELIDSNVSPTAVTNFTENEALQVFESGDSAFMRNWPYAWSLLQKDNSKVKGLVGVTTMVAIKEKYKTATLGSWGFSIIKSSENKIEAMKIINYLTSLESQKHLFINNGYTPISSRIFEDKKLLEEYPILIELKKALEITKPRPETPLYAQISEVVQRGVSGVITEYSQIDDQLNEIQLKTNQIILSAGEK